MALLLLQWARTPPSASWRFDSGRDRERSGRDDRAPRRSPRRGRSPSPRRRDYSPRKDERRDRGDREYGRDSRRDRDRSRSPEHRYAPELVHSTVVYRLADHSRISDRDVKDEREDRDRRDNGTNGDDRKGMLGSLSQSPTFLITDGAQTETGTSRAPRRLHTMT